MSSNWVGTKLAAPTLTVTKSEVFERGLGTRRRSTSARIESASLAAPAYGVSGKSRTNSSPP